MPKFFFYVAVFVSVILGIVTVYLAYQNRSPRIFEPLLSILLGAVTATFITLVTLLKPTEIQGGFPVSIVVNNQNHLPAMLFPEDGRFSALRQQLITVSTVEVGEQPRKMTGRVVDFKTHDEQARFYSEVIQIALFKQLYGFLNYSRTGISVSNAANRKPLVRAVLSPELRTTEYFRLPGRTAAAALANNRFMGPTEKEFWSNPKVDISLPVGAQLSFPDSASMVLERPNYYRIKFTIQPVGSGKGYPPHLVDTVQETDVTTMIFSVEYEAKFNRFTAENPNSLEIKEWAPKLFAEMSREMGDPVN